MARKYLPLSAGDPPPVEVGRPPGLQLAAEGRAAVLGDGGGLLGSQRVGSHGGCPPVQRGSGVLPQQPFPFRALSRRAGYLQQRLGVAPSLSAMAFDNPNPSPTLSQSTMARRTSLLRPSRTTCTFWCVVRMSAGWTDSRLHITVRRARATSRLMLASSNQSSQMMITVAVVRRLVTTSGIPSAP